MTDDSYRLLDASKLTESQFNALSQTFRAGRIPESAIAELANSNEAKQTLADNIQKYKDDAAESKKQIQELTARLVAKETKV